MKLKSLFRALIVTSLSLAAMPAFSIPQNLPHHNRSDVDDEIKVFYPNSVFATTSGVSVVGTGNPEFGVVNNLGFTAVRILNTGHSAHFLYYIPDNFCVDCPINVSVLWSTNSTTTSQTATWKVEHGGYAVGEAFGDATTELDTAITADSVLATAYMQNETAQGVINANTFSRGDIVNFAVQLDAASGLNPASDIVFLHGVFIEHVRQEL